QLGARVVAVRHRRGTPSAPIRTCPLSVVRVSVNFGEVCGKLLFFQPSPLNMQGLGRQTGSPPPVLLRRRPRTRPGTPLCSARLDRSEGRAGLDLGPRPHFVGCSLRASQRLVVRTAATAHPPRGGRCSGSRGPAPAPPIPWEAIMRWSPFTAGRRTSR